MSDLPKISSVFLIKAHLYGSDVEDIEWGPNSCSVRTTSGCEFCIDRALFKKILSETIRGIGEAEKDETWGPWGWQNEPKTVSKQMGDISDILTNLSKLEILPEETQVQLAQAALLCIDASYTAVGEDPEVDSFLTDVTVAMEEKNDA